MATFDVNKALKDGYTMAEIQEYMTANNLQPKKTVGGFVSNVGESAVKTAQGIVQPLLTPVQTVKDLGNLAIGVAQLAIPGKQDKEKFAKALGQFYLDRYGSLEKASNTIYSDPVGVVADISTVIGGGAGILKAGGQATKIGGLTRAGQRLGALTPETLAMKGLSAVAPKGIMAKAGAKLEQFGKEYALRGIRPSQSSIKKFSEKFRTPMEDWVAKQGLTVDQLEELRNPAIPTSQTTALEPLYSARKSAIKGTKKTVTAEELKNAFRKRINELRTGADADVPQSQKLAQDLENYLQQYIGTTEPTITDPLLNEARKYKSAEEFVKGQGTPMYRGTRKPQVGQIREADTYGLAYGKGVYVTPNKEFAKSYGENISELYPRLNNPLKMADEASQSLLKQFKKDFPDWNKDYGTTGEDLHAFIGNPDDANEYFAKIGFDGLLDAAKGSGADQTIIFNPSQVLTKSQLTDIYNQAQQIKPKTVRQRDVAENIPLSEIDDLRSKFDQATVQSEFMKSPDTSFNRIMGDTFRKIVNEKAGTTDVGRKISQYETFAEIARKSPSGKGNIPLGLGTGVWMQGLENVWLVGPVAGAAVREFINAPRTVQKVSQATQKIGGAMQGMSEKATPAANVFRNTLKAGLEVGKAARMVTPEGLTMEEPEKMQEVKRADPIDRLLQFEPVQPKAPPQTKIPTTTTTTNAFSKVKKLRKGAFV
jgi:hypothetical protein